MDLLDALYQKKTVTKYTSEKIDNETLLNIEKYFKGLSDIPEGIAVDIEIIDNSKTHLIKTGMFSIGAPYCAVIYSEDKPYKYINAGCKLQRLSMYLCTLGLGTQYIQNAKLSGKIKEKDNMEVCAVLGFGHSKGSYYRDRSEADRMTSVQLSIYQEKPERWISRIIDAARFAPSNKNDQPWRFIVSGKVFHIYSKYRNALKMKKSEEIDFGGLFGNILTAAEELWLDIEMVRLEGLKQKQYSDDQYLVSVLLKTGEDVIG